MPRRQRKSEKATEQQNSDYANLNLMNNAAYGVTKKRVKQARGRHKTATMPAQTTPAPATANTSGSNGNNGGGGVPNSGSSTPKKVKFKMPSPALKAPQQQYYIPDGGSGGNNSLVFLLMMILLVLVFWGTIVVPVASVAWDPSANKDITKLPWKQFLIAFTFVIVVTFISSINDQTYKAMIFFVAALYVVYVVETQGGVVTQLAKWANSNTKAPSSNQGQGSGNTQSPPTGGFA